MSEPEEKTGLALGLTLIAALFASIMLTLPKYAGFGVHPVQITFLRYATGILTLMVFYGVKGMIRSGRNGPDSAPQRIYENWTWLHILRAVMAAARITCTFAAVSMIPLANAQAILLTNGVFMMLFAAIFLHEKVPAIAIWLGAACIGGGFLAADPDLADPESWLSIGAGLAFVAAILFGLEAVIIKFTAVRDSNRRILFTVNFVALVLSAIPAFWLWTPMPFDTLKFLLVMGPVAILVQTCNMEALRRARASIIVPMRYTVVVFGVLIGIAVFNEFPSFQAAIGMTVIVLSGALLAWSTNRRQRKMLTGT
jgi:drug/metabolite transporter (DMT)-like permease